MQRDSIQPSLILIRHGRPEIREDIRPSEWRLSVDGRAAAAVLTGKLSGLNVAAALSSPEPKALATTQIVANELGVRVELEPDLREHQRESWGFAPDVMQARVSTVLRRPARSCHGAETGKHACERFESVLARNRTRPLLIGSHGTVLSLYLSRLLRVHPVALWRSLGFAEAILLNASGELIARVKSGDP